MYFQILLQYVGAYLEFAESVSFALVASKLVASKLVEKLAQIGYKELALKFCMYEIYLRRLPLYIGVHHFVRSF